MSNGLRVHNIELVQEEGGFDGYHLTIEVLPLSPHTAEELLHPDAAKLDGWNMVSSIIVENAADMRCVGEDPRPNIVIKTTAQFGDITATPEAARQAIVHFAKYLLNACK